jgi:hypothetical protein
VSISMRTIHLASIVALIGASVALANATQDVSASREISMNQHARGPFEVKLGPLEPYNSSADAKLARLSLDKQYHGDLEAVSKGEMLATGSAKDFGGYVALERVTGTLHGRSGSFALQHNGTMSGGVPYLNIIVVPGSGSGELAGLSGKMNIIIAEGGKHSYEFEYAIDK